MGTWKRSSATWRATRYAFIAGTTTFFIARRLRRRSRAESSCWRLSLTITRGRAPVAHENCGKCNRDYNLTPETAEVRIHIDDPICNHIIAECTHCHHKEVIYAAQAALLRVLGSVPLPVVLAEATPELKARAAATWGSVSEATPDPNEAPPPEVPIPRDWLRQLHDDLREFGGQA